MSRESKRPFSCFPRATSTHPRSRGCRRKKADGGRQEVEGKKAKEWLGTGRVRLWRRLDPQRERVDRIGKLQEKDSDWAKERDYFLGGLDSLGALGLVLGRKEKELEGGTRARLKKRFRDSQGKARKIEESDRWQKDSFP